LNTFGSLNLGSNRHPFFLVFWTSSDSKFGFNPPPPPPPPPPFFLFFCAVQIQNFFFPPPPPPRPSPLLLSASFVRRTRGCEWGFIERGGVVNCHLKKLTRPRKKLRGLKKHPHHKNISQSPRQANQHPQKPTVTIMQPHLPQHPTMMMISLPLQNTKHPLPTTAASPQRLTPARRHHYKKGG